MTRLRIDDPLVQAAQLLCGETLTEPVSRLHLLGLGARSIRKGSKMWPGHRENHDLKEAQLREALAAWDAENPAFVAWRKSATHLNRKEGFVTNPFGRRAYGLDGKGAQAFLILSTASDALKDLLLQIPGRIEHIEFCRARISGAPTRALQCALPFLTEE